LTVHKGTTGGHPVVNANGLSIEGNSAVNGGDILAGQLKTAVFSDSCKNTFPGRQQKVDRLSLRVQIADTQWLGTD
jgi:hypothetical protein